ncbi:MAG: hypothetical protein H5T72_07380 [Actinobacteria bacterium]|nr:hypothetical protein [Actinomycetota bacterium]
MSGSSRQYASTVPLCAVPLILALVTTMLLTGCGSKTDVNPVPGETTGRPQVVNFWQPG